MFENIAAPLFISGFNTENSGQSYNHFTIVNYDSSVVIWGIFKSGTTLEAQITIIEAL